MPITWLDIIVLAFMLISGLLAMARGFNREILTIVSWIAAAFATLSLFPRLQPQAHELLQPEWLADMALVFAIFLITLLVVTFISVRIADRILDSQIGALDRTAGLLFGLARGLFIVGIGYLFFTGLVPEEHRPRWVVEAKSRIVLDKTSEMIMSALPDDPSALLEKVLPGRNKAVEDGAEPAADAPAPEPSSDAGGNTPSAYQRSERQGLNQLLESTRPTTQ